MKLRIAKKIYKRYLQELPAILSSHEICQRYYRAETRSRATIAMAKHWARERKAKA